MVHFTVHSNTDVVEKVFFLVDASQHRGTSLAEGSPCSKLTDIALFLSLLQFISKTKFWHLTNTWQLFGDVTYKLQQCCKTLGNWSPSQYSVSIPSTSEQCRCDIIHNGRYNPIY